MPKARARMQTAPPIRPKPTIPSVLPKSSVPMNGARSHRPARTEADACGMCRASASSSAKVCSVAAIVFAAGVLTTTMPACVAASTSMASTPTPARPTTRMRGDRAMRSLSTRVSERTMRPSASCKAASRSAREWPTHEMISMPRSCSTSCPHDANGSAKTTRMDDLGTLGRHGAGYEPRAARTLRRRSRRGKERARPLGGAQNV